MKKKIVAMVVLSTVFTACPFIAERGEYSASAEEATESDLVPDDLGDFFSKLNIGGGISGGYFYASSPREGVSGSEFLLTNLLVEISNDKKAPINFVAAFGETSAPSVLDPPENNRTVDIEYASLNVRLFPELSMEVGLLGPNSGFENTYTYENANILLGAVASQQPYNAYGAKFGYEVGGLSLWGGYYKDRLDKEEYNTPSVAWEVGIGGEVAGNDIGFYHYHVSGFRNLTGVVIERKVAGVEVGINADYWAWDGAMKDFYGSDSSLGGAIYICPHFGDLSLPMRLEYVKQDESEIYIENPGTGHIFTAVVTPTYHFSESAYARAEVSYVAADKGFSDEDGGRGDCNTGLAIEFGLMF